MATDPTRRIRNVDNESPLITPDLSLLHRLASVSPSVDIPIVTAVFDWRIEGTHPGTTAGWDDQDVKRSSLRNADPDSNRVTRRPARVIILQQLQALVDEHGPRGPVYDSLTEDLQSISTFLDDDLDPSAQGVVIVSCAAKGLFEAIPLSLPVETRLHIGPTIALSEIARTLDDYPGFAVLLADQQMATLSIVRDAITQEQVEVEGSSYPRKQKQGGWSERRFQARADERVEAFARDIAQETRRALDESDVDMLIVAGDEVITSALDASFHQTVKDRQIASIRLDIRSSSQDILAATLPLVVQEEQARERVQIQRLSDAVGEGGFGVLGVKKVIDALQAGQVDTLIITDAFSEKGWADYSMPAFGVGPVSSTHPLLGEVESMVSVDLKEEIVRLSILTGVRIDFMPMPSEMRTAFDESTQQNPQVDSMVSRLDAVGGIGAILRFTTDVLSSHA